MAKTSEKHHFFGFRGGWLTFWITVACATDMMLFGYDQGVFSGVVVTQDSPQLHNLVGPAKTNLLATQMIVGRIVLGIGNGINTATAPIWQSETAQARWGGKLVILEMAMNIAGFYLVNWINYGLSFVEGSVAWRFPLAFHFVFIFVLFATVPWLPQSPRWLIAHGHTGEATEILAYIEDKPITSPIVTAQLHEIQITNFIVVEITPIGIQNLGWRFCIVWTVTNALFLPVIYFFYPETCRLLVPAQAASG
ncbi:hypothetical protein EDB82DRAFT_527394 [Fusarium venenatum]|uniref:uncharacterized protein n=1 Tax=Fusarium venenatum TaxID=56646 RepID=UPI001D577128|nr:hypothetical protein EDB82DRAFT_527394 [Fusarium venenatum]